MGKIVTIYLSDRESSELKAFCDENQCTQYSALKTAVRELLSKPTKIVEETHPIEQSNDIPEKDFEEDETIKDEKQNDNSTISEPKVSLGMLLERMRRRDQ
jgi:hypothetical protein